MIIDNPQVKLVKKLIRDNVQFEVLNGLKIKSDNHWKGQIFVSDNVRISNVKSF
jgi:hypothetical protein